MRVDRGEYARARGYLYNRNAASSTKLSDKQYLLDRERLLMVTLADGLPEHAESLANRVYEILRIQGLNADKTVPSVVFNDGVRIWKGEPFEQAMAYAYVAIQKGSIGDWGNMRAAAESSLFLLRDFGVNERGERLSTLEIAQKAVQKGEEGDAYLDSGYVVGDTDFALGYLLHGIASHALGRTEEASDNFGRAVELRPELAAVTDAIASGRADTILIVDAGRGPSKVAYGPDGSLARFEPRTRSDDRTLSVDGDAIGQRTLAQAADLNRMAQDHMWNNLEDVRKAKSTLGTALLVGGIVVASAVDDDNGTAQIIGLSAAAIGALMKASAGADLRHLESLPQRTYIVPLDLPEEGATVRIRIGDLGQAEMALAGMRPPDSSRGERLQLRYVRIPTVSVPLAWMTSGEIRYGNDGWAADVPGDDMPYILGGRCVRAPTHEVMARYHARGRLLGMTLADLLELYRLEGIVTDPGDELLKVGVHVLEGGNSLACPQAGTAGYARLFGAEHPPYEPKSKEVRKLGASILAQTDVAGATP
jgi:tetratricopeptide (TPR) repeat protein